MPISEAAEAALLASFSESLICGQETDIIPLLPEDLHLSEDWKRCLVLKVIAEKPSRFNNIREWIRRIWNPSEPWQLLHFHKHSYLLKLSEEPEIEKILNNGPWLLDGDYLATTRCVPNSLPAEYDFNKIDLWIRIAGLPVGALNSSTVMKLACQVGSPHQPSTEESKHWAEFARIKVSRDLSAPLRPFILSSRPEGDIVKFPVQYEKLPRFCHFCGRIGHEEQSCHHLTVLRSKILPSYSLSLQDAMSQKLKPQFGDWMRANPPSSVSRRSVSTDSARSPHEQVQSSQQPTFAGDSRAPSHYSTAQDRTFNRMTPDQGCYDHFPGTTPPGGPLEPTSPAAALLLEDSRGSPRQLPKVTSPTQVISVAPTYYSMQTGYGDDAFGVLLKQGAQARVFESNFLGRKSIVKKRFSTKYWHPTLDSKLTSKHLNAEARCMTKARRLGVLSPTLYGVDPLLHTLTLEYIEGPTLKEVLLDNGSHGVIKEKLNDIAMQIGNAIGKLHDGGLIHGDLTTSNMIISEGTNQLVLIDFGLSFTSTHPEDKAVDLFVLERSLLFMYSSCGNVMDWIVYEYKTSTKQPSATLNKLAQVRQRGGNRTMVG